MISVDFRSDRESIKFYKHLPCGSRWDHRPLGPLCPACALSTDNGSVVMIIEERRSIASLADHDSNRRRSVP